jgi:hypothetical protein
VWDRGLLAISLNDGIDETVSQLSGRPVIHWTIQVSILLSGVVTGT